MDEREWKEASLSEVCDIIGGGTPKTFVAEYWNGNIPWLSVADFNNDNRHVFITEKTITEQGLKNSSTKLLNTGDLIISARGTVGVLAQLAVPMAFNQSCYGIRAKPMTINDFLYYAIKNIIGQIKANTHGSVFDTITRATFDNLKILLPLLPEQKAIVTTLSCLDDKIELNNRINKTLEEIAQAIFKSWFVDFEPFTDGEFKDSELGRIPKGWRVESLDNIADFLNGLAMQKYRSKTDDFLPVIKIRELNQGFTDDSSDKASVTIPEQYIINNGDVIFSWSGTLEVKIWTGEKGALNQHLFKVTSKKYEKWFYHLWTLKHLEKFRAIAQDKATTMGHIRRKDLTESKVLIPKDSDMKFLSNILNPIYEKIIKLYLENRTLKEIRDTLLPKLMSGEIRVPIEEVITDKQG